MKRFAWLLVVPYMVNVSTREIKLDCVYVQDGAYTLNEDCKIKLIEEYALYLSISSEGHKFYVSCQSDCEWIYDLAEALNQARERREKRD